MPEGVGTAQSDVAEVINSAGAGASLILCEHASNHIPARYDGLGLRDSDHTSHVAWDPGARELALGLSRALDAPMVAGRISRLVYDCNRPPQATDAVPEQSELVDVPGNRGLSEGQRQERIDTIYQPFSRAVADLIAARKAQGIEPVLITIHSFTPFYFDERRDVEIGVLHDADAVLADAMLAGKQALAHRQIKRNQPYGPGDGVMHSLKLHGIANGMANVMIEVRNDLLKSPEDEATMTAELLTLLRPALAAIGQEAVLHA